MNAPDLSIFVALARRVRQALADSFAGAGAWLLSFRAIFTRPGSAGAVTPQTLYLSSIRKQRGANWVEVFSQDRVQVPATSSPETESA
jgi:hypothetical protein